MERERLMSSVRDTAGLPIVVVILLLACSTVRGSVGEPVFPNDEAAKSFAAGRVHFEARRYEEAKKLFKACRKGAPPDTTKTVDGWLKACKGGIKLRPVYKAIEKKSWRSAWQRLEKIRKGYRDTPLRTQLDALEESIGKELFFWLSTFEKPIIEPERGAVRDFLQTARYNTDPAYVRSGERSARWTAEAKGRKLPILPLGKFSGRILDDYRYLSLWIYDSDNLRGNFLLFFNGSDSRVLQQGSHLPKNSFYMKINTSKVGWKHYRFDLEKDLAKEGAPSFADVHALELMVFGHSQKKTIYIDDVRLEK